MVMVVMVVIVMVVMVVIVMVMMVMIYDLKVAAEVVHICVRNNATQGVNSPWLGRALNVATAINRLALT